MACFGSIQAAQVNETQARQIAGQFFSAKSPRFNASAGQSTTRLAYTAESERFFVFERGNHNGFVVVAGDDRLPQVLGYGESGDFSAKQLPDAVQYWLDEMNRQIAFLQSHGNVAAHQPAKRQTAVAPLLTTQWSQEAPYNDLCPTYETNGVTSRAVTGCVATATAQIMNYYKWPAVGRGSHSYVCNVNNVTRTELSADFSQSVYQWDLMLDFYDSNSSAESCEAVAKLMSDVGISMDMGYGSSSGASEMAASQALNTYFGYNARNYWLNRDYYGAAEWDQLLFDEISARRPVMYCGYSFSGIDGGGHAFVLDGFNADGYFHVNWGWGGYYDGYFVVSVLAPTSSMNFEFMQDGLFGLVPENQDDAVEDFIAVRGQLTPMTSTAPLSGSISIMVDNIIAQGNSLDTAGFEQSYGRKRYYALLPLSLGVFDKDGVEIMNEHFDHRVYLNDSWSSYGRSVTFSSLQSLQEGEYMIKLGYSLHNDGNYDRYAKDYSSQDLYVKMFVSNDSVYLYDCFLSNTYTVETFVVPRGIMINKPFSVAVDLSYNSWGDGNGPVGNVYLSILKDGVEIAAGDLCEVELANNTVKTYEMQIIAPTEWGSYDLVLKDESGNQLMKMDGWMGGTEIKVPIFVLPVCQELVEDFESMTANSSTTEKNVQGNFTTWSFYKSGVRSPGEGLCNGNNAVMMKKPSYVYSTEPLHHNFIMAQATFFNPVSAIAKYTFEYSVDGGATWQKANTIDNVNVAEVPEKSQTLVTWLLNVPAAKPACFRITMIGGGSSATYVDDISLYYFDPNCDVNGDGEVNIADVNVLVDLILAGGLFPAADVNGDGEINVSDINIIIDTMLLQ